MESRKVQDIARARATGDTNARQEFTTAGRYARFVKVSEKEHDSKEAESEQCEGSQA